MADLTKGRLISKRPVHSLVLVFALTACALFNLERIIPGIGRLIPGGVKYDAIPLEENASSRQRISFDEGAREIQPLRSRSLKISLLFSSIIIATRVEIYRRVSHASECTAHNPEVSNIESNTQDLRFIFSRSFCLSYTPYTTRFASSVPVRDTLKI
ncbi:MAG: hypothetical protein Q9160_001779 [Pyrenula sp. 1 TL-2023]